MPRPPRYAFPGVLQHPIQRGDNRPPVFFHADDYRFSPGCLTEAAATYGSAVHADVPITNHVHVLLTPRQPGSIATVAQSSGRRYLHLSTRRINALGRCEKGGTRPA